MRSGDKGHRSCKGHREMNQVLEMLRSQIWLTNSGESPPAANGRSQWAREPGGQAPPDDGIRGYSPSCFMSGLDKERPYRKEPASSLLRPPLSTPESFSSGSS